MPQDKPLIIIVDDQKARAQAIRLALPDIGIDLRLKHAADQKTLIDCLQQEAPALILCAPDSETLGVSLIREILAKENLHPPLVAFADLVRTDPIVNLVSMGADDVADLNKSDHLTMVAARHLGAMDQLREHWRLREDQGKATGAKDKNSRSLDQGEKDEWRQRLMKAVKDRHFSLSRQKISSLATDESDQSREFIDILLRLDVEQDNSSDRLPAGRFIEQARRAGLAPLIDGWVVQQVCLQLGKLNAKGLDPLFFVRLEPDTLNKAKASQLVSKFLNRYKASANGLAFEITEKTLRSPESTAITQLQALRKLGCCLSLSHCSVSKPWTGWPKGLKPDFIKLNPDELIRLMGQTDAVNTLKAAVNKMHAEDAQVIAPQIEHADSLAVIWSSGVDFAQGYYQSHPEVVLSS